MYSYQKRSETKQSLRSSQFKDNCSSSNYSRGSSRKKFLDVYSKKSEPNQKQNLRPNLSNSMVSLPVNFEDCRQIKTNNQHLSRSQAVLVLPSRHQQISRSNYQSHVRTQSVPIRTLIIRQTIKPVPINFSIIQPSNIHLQPQSNYRHSLPLKYGPMPNKNDIVRIEQARQIPSPVTMFSNFPCQNIPNIRKQPYSIQNSTSIKVPQKLIIHNSQPKKHIQIDKINYLNQSQQKNLFFERQNPIMLPQKSQFLMKTEQISLKNQNQSKKLLSNVCYLQSQYSLDDFIPKNQCQSLKLSKISEQSKSDGKQINKDSVVKIKQVSEEDSKQNIQIKSHCICSKLQSFSQCSEIKINKNQVLMPKKNFVFV